MRGENYHHFKNEFGEMKAAVGTVFDGYSSLCDSIASTVDFNESLSNIILMIFEAEELTVGMLSKIEVFEGHRGNGHGKAMFSRFIQNISSKTDVDIIFARIENRQLPGFSLQRFYEKEGFEPVLKSYGELLMANKGYAKILKEALLAHAPRHALITEAYSCDY